MFLQKMLARQFLSSFQGNMSQMILHKLQNYLVQKTLEELNQSNLMQDNQDPRDRESLMMVKKEMEGNKEKMKEIKENKKIRVETVLTLTEKKTNAVFA